MASSDRRLLHPANQESQTPRCTSPLLLTSPIDSPRSFTALTSPHQPTSFSPDFVHPGSPFELVMNTADGSPSTATTERPSEGHGSNQFRRAETCPNGFQTFQNRASSPACTEGQEKRFTIRNTDTGLEIDLRDENKSDFPLRLAKVLSGPSGNLQTYCKQKREVNEKLWEAIKNGDLAICKDLLNREKHGELTAQPNAKSLDDWTSLHLAAHSGHLEICRVLLEYPSTEVDCRSTIQRTPLHIAASKNHPDVVDLLLAHGASINAVDNEGCTALHMAASFGHIHTVKRILTYNPDFAITNRMERTCYDVSATTEISDVLENYLEQRGVRIDTDRYSRTRLGGVLMHNSRADMVAKILYKAAQRTDPQALRICFGNIPKAASPEPQTEAPFPTSPSSSISNQASEPAEEEKSAESAKFNDFTPICPLGCGAFGEVFLIRKNDSGDLFAMKLLKKGNLVKQNLIRYAMTERNVMTYLKHPFIVSLKYAFQTPEKLALILDYCPGGSLAGVLKRENRFNEDRARLYACEVLLALEELHAHGIVYRDLKPDNIVLDAEGHALLTDFGLSKEGIFESIMTKSFCGSVAYMPPEMISRSGHTHTVDFYLFGVLIYEMLSGSPPFYSNGRSELYHNILNQKLKLPRKWSSPVRDLVARLLDRNPSTRLGAGGVSEIKSHSWFSGIVWESVLRKEQRPVPVFEKKRKIPKTPLTMEKIFNSGSRTGPTVEGWSFIGDKS